MIIIHIGLFFYETLILSRNHIASICRYSASLIYILLVSLILMALFYIRLITRLPNDLMLNHWLKKKNNLIVIRFRFRGAEKVNKPCTFCVLRGIFVSLGNEQKIGECHAIAYGILRWWCKYEVREFAHFVRFSFRVMKVY